MLVVCSATGKSVGNSKWLVNPWLRRGLILSLITVGGEWLDGRLRRRCWRTIVLSKYLTLLRHAKVLVFRSDRRSWITVLHDRRIRGFWWRGICSKVPIANRLRHGQGWGKLVRRRGWSLGHCRQCYLSSEEGTEYPGCT